MPIPFRPIARLLTRTLNPAPILDLSAVQSLLQKMQQRSAGQGMLITANHYSAPDFQAWWIAILISAVVPLRIHWVVTSGWTNSGWLTGFTQWLFPRGARLFGFTPMPAMPPDPAEAEQRALAVRQVLRYAKLTSNPVIGLVPEGGDHPGGVLGSLPPGVGRFMQLLSQPCQNVIPVGVWTAEGRINLKFGSPYLMEIPSGLPAHARDKHVGEITMRHIAELMPEGLRGAWQYW